jgi:hypothetical protein
VRGPGRLGRGLLALLLLLVATVGAGPAAGAHPALAAGAPTVPAANTTAVANFTGAMNRLVTLVAAAGGAVLALVWARVALSWFSNDIAKKVQAKDRARDALIGTLLFLGAVSGLAFALAQWVVSGT